MTMNTQSRDAGSAGVEAERDEVVSRRGLVTLLGAAAGAAVLSACAEAVPERRPATGKVGEGVIRVSGGTGTVVWPTLAAAIDSASSGEPRTIVIDHEVPDPVGENVPAHVTLRFEDHGRIKPASNVTTTISGPIEAVAEPDQPIFDVSAGGSGVKPAHAGTKYYANWWSGGNIGERWNNMVRHAARGVVDPPAPQARHFAVAGRHQYQTSFDLTGFSGRQIMDFSQAVLFYNGSAHVAVDMTNSSGLTINHLTLLGAGRVGLLLARATNGSADAGGNVLINARVSASGEGAWTEAALYNIGSEHNQFVGGDFLNGLIEDELPTEPVPRTVCFANANLPGAAAITSVHRLDPTNLSSPVLLPGSSGQVAGQELLGTRIHLFSTAPNETRPAALSISGFGGVTWTNGYVNVRGTHSRYVLVSANSAKLTGPVIDNVFGHGEAWFAVEIAAAAPTQRIEGMRLTTRQLFVSQKEIYVGAVTLSFCHFAIVGQMGFECHEQAVLLDAHLEVQGELNGFVRLGKEFRGTIYMGNVPNKLLWPEDAIIEGSVVGITTPPSCQGCPPGPAVMRVYSPLELRGNHLLMDDAKGIFWGQARIRGSSSSSESLAFTDNAGTTVATVRAGKFRVNSGALGIMSRTGNPGAQEGEAVIWVAANGDLWVTIRAYDPNVDAVITKTLRLVDFAASPALGCAVC
jgi:hypothetical protein